MAFAQLAIDFMITGKRTSLVMSGVPPESGVTYVQLPGHDTAIPLDVRERT
jgi:hypothetical protein